MFEDQRDLDAALEESISPTERAFLALEYLAQQNSLSMNDMIKHLGMSKTAAHRLLTNLEKLGYIRKTPDRCYRTAPRLLNFAIGVTRSALTNASIHALMVKLTELTGESTSLAVLNKSVVEYIDSAIAPTFLALQFQTGQQAPLHCTSSGRIFLSHMSNHEIESYLLSSPWPQLTPSTVSEAGQLLPILETIRRRGYAITDSEFSEGVIGAAVPVFSADNHLIACLGISAPKARKTEADIQALIPVMKEIAQEIGNAV